MTGSFATGRLSGSFRFRRGGKNAVTSRAPTKSTGFLTMRSDRPRRLVARVLMVVPALIAGCMFMLSPARADEARKPAKADSAAAIKPKTATLTTAVEPAEAKPGDTVTFKVTAKMDSGYHIYKYSTTQGEGPIQTSFDFFDPADLKIEDEWTPSADPQKHKDPNFNNMEVEYYEDEVTWSIKLKIPADAAPGEKNLRCQARYMVCDDKTCSIPGRWTLPTATVKVVAGGGAAPKSSSAAAPAGEARKPAKADSAAAIKPKTATLTTAVEPAQAKPGDTVTFKVTARLNPGFHIYKYSKTQGEGPIQTSFEFFDPSELKIEGEWTPSAQPQKHEDPNFNNMDVEYYEGEVTWSINLKVPAETTPGEKSLRCQARYMVCDATSCSIPGRWTLATATVNVSGGNGTGPKPAAAAHSAPEGESGAAATRAAVSKDDDSATKPVAASAPPSKGAQVQAASTAAANAAPSAGAASPAAASSAPPAAADRTSAVSSAGAKSTTSERPAASQVQSEIADRAQAGLLPFLLASALGGLFALVMPCVWPMVPVTVNFFVKQGQGKGGRKRATMLAFVYCLSIIGVFTAVGVLFSVFFSASSLQTLANNPWLNLFVAGLFVIFGLSLLGLFELRLPGFLLNASAQQESRGGIIGVVFMALTLTITSFTCTFPVVGGLLVMAAGGDYFYPIIGLATFAAVLALPFLLLALSPSLISRMPRSGDWMNAIKVVGGLVEIGAALKFLNTAELAWVVPEDAWFDAHVVLTCWIALSVVCGLYLLGVFRTDHDHGDLKVGSMRILSACLFLGLAVYMLPALFGRPPQSMVWDRLIIGLLPPDASEFRAPEQIAGDPGSGGGGMLRSVKATSTDPAQAEREEKKAHGVLWGMSLEQAKEQAKAENKPILIDFTGENCANCRAMENHVLPRPEVVSLLKKFVTIELYTDFVPIGSITADQREELATRNAKRLVALAKEATNPIYVALSPDGDVLGRLGGLNSPNVFVNFLTDALDKLPPDMKVAETSSRPLGSEKPAVRD
jgi:thiol:disulfide interchange protein DsbD